ncbi:unnamed protein product [Angiostrongylus costaricensis]|uniref:GOLD domain-containing protein n=1 Tax=Angiostrongylus costaricensis TaxID=334426 RepID=A0A0R3Q2H1_ANGCS|nr:unnamed protein product [Angiostrongylus costaricensis]
MLSRMGYVLLPSSVLVMLSVNRDSFFTFSEYIYDKCYHIDFILCQAGDRGRPQELQLLKPETGRYRLVFEVEKSSRSRQEMTAINSTVNGNPFAAAGSLNDPTKQAQVLLLL